VKWVKASLDATLAASCCNRLVGAFLGPLLAVLLLISFHIKIRWSFYLAIIPGLLAFSMILLVKERPVPMAARSKIDISVRQFPKVYWR
jgi:MFS family permease